MNKEDESFYNSFSLDALKKLAEDFPREVWAIRLYSSEYFKLINDYLRTKKLKYSKINDITKKLKECIDSWIYCLHKEIRNMKNVEDDQIVYRGIATFKFPPEIKVGSEFYFGEFLSTSKKKDFAIKWIKEKKVNEGTLMKIIIKNNKRNNYCCYIEDFTFSKNQDEVLLTCNCCYKVTNIIRTNQLDYINLICYGFNSN